MKNNNFNPIEWANKNPNNPSKNTSHAVRSAETDEERVRELAGRLVADGADITQGYTQWRNLGFALADGLGEQGRDLYHSLSSVNAQYNQAECDKQYTACLNSRGGGITIATFFHLAKEAGYSQDSHLVNGCERTAREVALETDPLAPEQVRTFSDKVLPHISPLLQEVAQEGRDVREQDMLLLAALAVLSAAFGNIKGVYDKRKVYPNIYGYVVAPAASSKGILASVYKLVGDIDEEIRRQNQAERDIYQQEMDEYLAASKKCSDRPKPVEPPYRALRIPANGSATATYQALNDNHGWGITFETEGDTMANALKSDYGDYSEGMRNAAHHETIQYNRRKENEHVLIREPRWSILITSTPGQLPGVFPSAENGLFSRFLFLRAPRNMEWHDVFATDEHTIDETMERLGKRVYALYQKMNQLPNPIAFSLTKAQQRRFNQFFSESQTEFYQLLDDNIVATIRRLGLSAFRIMMILSALRLETEEQLPERMECADADFEAALAMVEAMMEHAAQIYSNYLQKAEEADKEVKLAPKKLMLLNALPDTFDCGIYREAGMQMGLSKSRADNIVSDLLLKDQVIDRIATGRYKKKTVQVSAK